VYPSRIGAGICAGPTADALATGEVNCHHFIGHSQGFQRRSAKGTECSTMIPGLLG